MTESDIAKWFLFGALVGGIIVHVFWHARFRESLDTYRHFLHYLRQGYSVEQAWTRAMTDQVTTEGSSIDGGASALTAMLADHPYYCSESNYYSNEAGSAWETMTDFLAEFESADEDMNLVFRWDIRQRDEDNPGRYYAEVFMMHQRKGIFSPHHIKNINEAEAVRFRTYLEKHWKVMLALWAPLSAND